MRNCSLRIADVSASLQYFGDLLDGPVSTTIVLLGAIGNIYCVRVLQSKPMHERMKMNLLCLALTDLLLMITLLGYYSFEATLRFSGINKFQFDLLTVRLHGVAELANTASTWLVILVTVQRFQAVSQPFRSNTSSINHRTSLRITARNRRRASEFRDMHQTVKRPFAIILLASLINLPVMAELKVVKCFDPFNGYLSQQIEPTQLRLDWAYQFYYRTILSTCVKTFGPFVLIVVLSVFTIIDMHKSVMMRRSLRLHQKAKRRSVPNNASQMNNEKCIQIVTILLLTKFLALRCWPTVLDIWETIGHWSETNLKSSGETFQYMVKITNLLVVINSATNCLIFVAVKKAFRKNSHLVDGLMRKLTQKRRSISMPFRLTSELSNTPSQVTSKLSVSDYWSYEAKRSRSTSEMPLRKSTFSGEVAKRNLEV